VGSGIPGGQKNKYSYAYFFYNLNNTTTMYKTIISSMLALSVASIACSQNDEASPKQSKTSLDITAGLSFNTTHFPSNSNYQKLNSYNNFSFGLYIEKEITKR